MKQPLAYNLGESFARIYKFQREFTVFYILYEQRQEHGKATEQFKEILIEHFCISMDTLNKWDARMKGVIKEISAKFDQLRLDKNQTF